ncbi:MAG: tetratricopeptide repeat protein [Rhizomicrobium sp.]
MDAQQIQALGRQAMALHQQGQLQQAEAIYRQLIAVAPGLFPPYFLLGMLRLQTGDSAAAATLLEQALKLQPNDPGALLHYGLALHGQKRFAQALGAYDRALGVQPNMMAAHVGRGGALRALDRTEEALAEYELALAANADDAEAWNVRGALLRSLKRIDEALDSMNRAVALAPNSAEALQNRGELLWDERTDYPAALADLERALALEPGRPALEGNLVHLQLMIALKDCDWTQVDVMADRMRKVIAAGSYVTPFMALLCDGNAQTQLQAARNVIAERFAPLAPLAGRMAYRHDRIKLAYISSDFAEHPVALQIARLIELHDRARFEVVGISTGPNDGGATRRRLAAAFDQFHDQQGVPPKQIAEFIRHLEIDILVELNGHTQRGSFDILRRKPAPIQVSWLGYAGTTGAPYIDYLIADRIAAANPGDFSERLEYLPHTFFATDNTRPIGQMPGRAEAGLPADAVVFCCFNQVMKFNAAIFGCWMRILAQVPGSVLWLRDPGEVAAANLRQAASDHGIAPERLIFAGYVTPEVHLARYALADLFLDTLPYNAHATACDALWAGLPVLTCAQGGFAGRVAASLLHAIAMPELVTQTPQDYEALAVSLARDPERLPGLRGKLAANRLTTALFDTSRFARDLEEIYIRIQAAQRMN